MGKEGENGADAAVGLSGTEKGYSGDSGSGRLGHGYGGSSSVFTMGHHLYTSLCLALHTTAEERLPAAGSTSVRTVKSMTREVKSKAVCWPL